ncbi:hypothetical protein ANCDUO_04570 [Ancylostoma duodenale]|uniref:Uncharacterized protein n=1 Tax=Ancylostoma duodenale TaxID=51022 RepID=A0A0C2H6N8_9BILA|nr:hypothetical protein ANCDUO_04570 [Ancylostoma duodenale]
MNRHFFSAAVIILVFLWRDDVLRYLHVIEDSLLPVDPLDLTFLGELQESEHGLILKGSGPVYANCSSWKLSINDTIGYGWSKSVHPLSATTELRCRVEILRGFINEIKMLLLLRDNSNVIKMISYCIPRDPLKNLENVNILTERGNPMDLFSLFQLSQSQRDHLFGSLLSFFAENPTLRLQDLKRQQHRRVRSSGEKVVDPTDN